MKSTIRRFNRSLLAAGLALGVLMVPLAMGGSSSGDTARYEVTFIPSWNPATHPNEYPLTHAKKGLLTPFIGATHGSSYRIFKSGDGPSPGLERLSEMGKHDPLDAEIKEAIVKRKAGSLIEAEVGSPGPVHAPVSLEFDVQRNHPQVSLVGMIAPSPDWFYGVSGVSLYKGGQWEPRVAIEAYAWDSGGDSGTTYLAEDMDLKTKAATRYAKSAHFVRNGKKVPVGTFVFKLIPGTES